MYVDIFQNKTSQTTSHTNVFPICKMSKLRMYGRKIQTCYTKKNEVCGGENSFS